MDHILPEDRFLGIMNFLAETLDRRTCWSGSIATLKNREQIFQACQKEKEDVVKEALHKKAKYLASIEKASNSSAAKLCSEDVLKRIVQKAGNAFKRGQGKLEARSSEKTVNSECGLCYAKFSKKRKRACLAPCGHASACFSCATKAWEKKPNCPVCEAAIEKPIPLPAQLFL